MNRVYKHLLALTLALFACSALAQSPGGQVPNGMQQFTDGNGSPYAGGRVYFYVPGTTTPKTTYLDPGLTTPNVNPVELDANGRAIIWGPTGALYRQVLTNKDGVTIWDQIAAAGNGLPLPLPVNLGGSGRSTLTQNSVLLGEGQGRVDFAVPGRAGMPLVSTGSTTDPVFGLIDPAIAIGKISNDTVLGNVSGSPAAPSALTSAQLTPLVDVFTTTSSGAVPISPGGHSKFLSAAGTFERPSGTAGNVAIYAVPGTYTFVIPSDVVYFFVKGPGGGGGSGSTTFGGSGGGEGGTAAEVYVGLTVGNTIVLQIPPGGPPGAAGATTTIASGTQVITPLNASGGSPGQAGGFAPAPGGIGGSGSGSTLALADGNAGGYGTANGYGLGARSSVFGNTGSGGDGGPANTVPIAGLPGGPGLVWITW